MSNTTKMMERLIVRDGQIMTASGESILLHGWNIGGWLNMEDFINGFTGAEHNLRATLKRILGKEKAEFFFERMLDHFFNEADVKAMAELGANVIRIPFNYRHFERDDQPFVYLDEGFQRLDQAFAWCAKYGIYIILDFHAVQGWQNPDWHSDNAHVHILLYEHQLFQDRFVALWQEMAKRYKDHPALAGYDLMNEPCTRVQYDQYDSPAYQWDALNIIHRKAACAIREIDQGHIIFVEGDNFSNAFDGLDVSFDDNLVISTHNYISPTIGCGPYPGVKDGIYWNRDIIAAEFGMHSGTRLAFRNHKPIFAGEFGVWFTGCPEAIPYRAAALDDQLGVFRSAGVHWTIWTWKDIASMGAYNLDPASRYVQMISPVIRAKNEITDWDEEMSVNPATAAFKQSVVAIDDIINKSGLNVQVDQHWFAQYSMFAYLAQLLQVPYANLFLGTSEKEIDELLSSFALDHCVKNSEIIAVVEKYL